MEPEGSLPHLQEPATCSYSEARSIQPMSRIPLLEDSFLYYFPIYAGIFQVVSFPHFPISTLYAPHLSPVLTTCPAHLIVLYLLTRLTFGEGYGSSNSSLNSCIMNLQFVVSYYWRRRFMHPLDVGDDIREANISE